MCGEEYTGGVCGGMWCVCVVGCVCAVVWGVVWCEGVCWCMGLCGGGVWSGVCEMCVCGGGYVCGGGCLCGGV